MNKDGSAPRATQLQETCAFLAYIDPPPFVRTMIGFARVQLWISYGSIADKILGGRGWGLRAGVGFVHAAHSTRFEKH